MGRNLGPYLDFTSRQSECTLKSFRSAHRSFASLEKLISSSPGEDELYDALQQWINSAGLHPATTRSTFRVSGSICTTAGSSWTILTSGRTCSHPTRYRAGNAPSFDGRNCACKCRHYSSPSFQPDKYRVISFLVVLRRWHSRRPKPAVSCPLAGRPVIAGRRHFRRFFDRRRARPRNRCLRSQDPDASGRERHIGRGRGLAQTRVRRPAGASDPDSRIQIRRMGSL